MVPTFPVRLFAVACLPDFSSLVAQPLVRRRAAPTTVEGALSAQHSAWAFTVHVSVTAVGPYHITAFLLVSWVPADTEVRAKFPNFPAQ